MWWVAQLRKDDGTLGETKYSSFEQPNIASRILVIISRFIDDSELEPDPPKRMGKYCVTNTYNEWMRRTGGGTVCMSTSECRKHNEETGSTMRKAGFVVPCPKQNCGIMHGIGGHTNHMNDLVGLDMKAKRRRCRWITRHKNFMNEVEEYRNKLGTRMNVGDVKKEEDFKKSLKDIRGKIIRA